MQINQSTNKIHSKRWNIAICLHFTKSHELPTHLYLPMLYGFRPCKINSLYNGMIAYCKQNYRNGSFMVKKNCGRKGIVSYIDGKCSQIEKKRKTY